VPLLLVHREFRIVVANWRAIALTGVLHYALPFSLFAYSMLTLSAGYSSIINASSPLFAGLVAWFWIGKRLSASQTTGLVVGMLGVVVLVWDKLLVGSGSMVLAVAASVLASFCYGFAAVLVKKHLAGVSPAAIAGGSMSVAALVLLPLSLWLWPDTPPSGNAWGMAAALGIACTAIAFVLYFRLIGSVGPTKAITVTFLIPVVAVILGAVLIDEQITPAMIGGGAIVILGTALSTGLVDVFNLLSRTRVFAQKVLVVVLAFNALDDTPPDAYAAEWNINAPVYFAANAFSYKTASSWDSFSTLSASAELELIPADRPWHVSLFTEYHTSSDERVDGTVFAGALASFRHEIVDMTAFWFSSQYPGAASRQSYMLRLRNRLASGHKLGVEYLAYVDDPGAGQIKLGYYASLGRSLSFKALAGTYVEEGWEPLVRLELSWQLL